jgi:2-iminoacetate synthase ThiH
LKVPEVQHEATGDAQFALRFGEDDLDGTVIEEKIYHHAGATMPGHVAAGIGSPDQRSRPRAG